MKVAIVGPYPLEGRPPGGIESVSAALVHGLQQIDDVEVHLITIALPGATPGVRWLGPRATLHALRSTGRLRRPTTFFFERRAITRLLGQLRPDIVHVQGQNFYAPAALASGFPTVISIHGMLAREAYIIDPRSSAGERISKRLRGIFNARFEAIALREAKHLIINNPYAEQTIGPLTKAQMHWLDNPIEDRFFDVPDTPEPRRVFFAGSFQPRKGVHHLVEATRIMRDRGEGVDLRIAGPVLDAGYAAEVRRTIADAGLSDTIRLLGVVNEATLLEEYARASVVVMASKEETSPMFLQQAMAAAKPAVAPDVGGIRYVIEDGGAGRLTAAEDARAIASALSAILSDGALRHRMSKAARAAAESRFRARAVAERTLAVYRAARRPD